jgi:hypothetical protein
METMRDQEATRYLTENEDGVQFTVVEWVKIITARPLSGPTSTAKGARRWTLLNGSAVNYVDENTFQVVETDEILRKV